MADEKETLGSKIGYPGAKKKAYEKDDEEDGVLATMKRRMQGLFSSDTKKVPAAQVSPSPKPKGK
jgi:hypothetical protein